MKTKGIIQEDIDITTASLKHLTKQLGDLPYNSYIIKSIGLQIGHAEYHLMRLKVMQAKLQYFSKRELGDEMVVVNAPKFITERVKWLWRNRDKIHFGWRGVRYGGNR